MLPSGEFKQESQELLVGGVLVKTVFCQTNSDSEGWLSGQYRYIYQVRNPETGLWEEIDADKINTLDKIRNFFGIASLPLITDEAYLTNLNYIASLSLNRETFSTDSDTFLGNISNMYNVIKGSTFATNSYVSSFGGSSTSKIPSSIPDFINEYFRLTSNLLCNLGMFLKKCENSNARMEETEKDIGTDAENLGDYRLVNLGSTDTSLFEQETSSKTITINSSRTRTSSGVQPSTSKKSKTTWGEEFSGYDELCSNDGKTVFYYNNQE